MKKDLMIFDSVPAYRQTSKPGLKSDSNIKPVRKKHASFCRDFVDLCLWPFAGQHFQFCVCFFNLIS